MDPKLLQDLFSAGPVGLCAILATVIIFLYRSSIAKDAQIQLLNDKLVEMSGRVESIVASSKAAVEQLVKSNDAAANASDDRFETIRSLVGQVEKLAEIIVGNRSLIGATRDDVVKGFSEIRADLRLLFRERQ